MLCGVEVRLRPLALVAALALGACSGPSPTEALRPENLITRSPLPRATATGLVSTRPATEPALRLENRGLGATKADIARAVADLKEVGLWDDLTDHLYVLKIATRPGLEDIPEDGHLADALLTAAVDDFGMGSACDIMFFPAAIARDLERWRGYYAEGLVPDPPPTLRQYWASILAHELGHCLNWEGGEPYAERWEARALAAVRRAGLE
jgi:hypothetical protein